MKKSNLTDELKSLFYECRELIEEKKDYEGLQKLCEKWTNDPDYVRRVNGMKIITILIKSHPFPEVKSIYEKLRTDFNREMEKKMNNSPKSE